MVVYNIVVSDVYNSGVIKIPMDTDRYNQSKFIYVYSVYVFV